MTNKQLDRIKLFYELISKVDSLKKDSNDIHRYSEDIFIPLKECAEKEEKLDSLQKQNDKVFNINLYVLVKLYEDEYNQIKEEKGKFTLEEYYEFIERIGLNDKVDIFYTKMPTMIEKNEILSYVTDNPSFMSMIR